MRTGELHPSPKYSRRASSSASSVSSSAVVRRSSLATLDVALSTSGLDICAMEFVVMSLHNMLMFRDVRQGVTRRRARSRLRMTFRIVRAVISPSTGRRESPGGALK